MTEYRYIQLYSDSGGEYLRQVSSESTTEFIEMERSVEDILECERDSVQLMYSDIYI